MVLHGHYATSIYLGVFVFLPFGTQESTERPQHVLTCSSIHLPFSFPGDACCSARAAKFKRAMEQLGPQRKLSMLVEELKLLKSPDDGTPVVPAQGEVLVPAHGDLRSPVLLMIGGGMGAGKSTVVKEVMQR